MLQPVKYHIFYPNALQIESWNELAANMVWPDETILQSGHSSDTHPPKIIIFFNFSAMADTITSVSKHQSISIAIYL
jgi:SNF2 family DNA or RNA helicase